MVPQKELNPFNRELFSAKNLLEQQRQERPATAEDDANANLWNRVTELESRNLYLQTLVVELLDKNEQLRRQLLQQQKDSETPLSSSPRS